MRADLVERYRRAIEHVAAGLMTSEDFEAFEEAATALRALRDAPVVAWTEWDGDEWIVYDAGSETGLHIRDHQKDRHFIEVFPIYKIRIVPLDTTAGVDRG